MQLLKGSQTLRGPRAGARECAPSRDGRFARACGLLVAAGVRTSTRSERGVTFVELMIALAVLSLVTVVSVASLGGLRPRMSVSVATQQFLALLGEAQSRALSTQRDVWVIVYASGAAPPASHGGFLLYEAQPGFDFGTWSALGGALPQSPGDRVGTEAWFHSAGSETLVSIDTAGAAFALSAPFAGSSSGCSFCSIEEGEGTRGAIVFHPDGQVSFVDGEGEETNAAQGVITLTGEAGDQNRMAVAVSAAGLARASKP